MSSGDPKTRTRILEATWRLMEERNGRGVRMRDVADAGGVSRQAVYDHFGSRAELMVATARYGDEVRGLEERLRGYRAAVSGVERLEAFIEFWGNYIPEIHGIARGLPRHRRAATARRDARPRVVARGGRGDALELAVHRQLGEPHARARLGCEPVRHPDARADQTRVRARWRVGGKGVLRSWCWAEPGEYDDYIMWATRVEGTWCQQMRTRP